MSYGEHSSGFTLVPPLARLPDPTPPLTAAERDRMIATAIRAAHTRQPSGTRRWAQAAAAALALSTGVAAAALIGHASDPREGPSVAGAGARTQDNAPARPPAAWTETRNGARTADIAPDANPSTFAKEASREPTPRPVQRRREVRAVTPDERQDLLEFGNRLRTQRRWRESEQVYARVARAHHQTDEAYSALVAAAGLRLVHLGDPDRARALYARALRLRPDGALSEEARRGIADCYRALGETRSERQALQALVDHHPSSPARARALARLDELE